MDTNNCEMIGKDNRCILRSSNIELLRIISMLMILGLHFWSKGMDVSQCRPTEPLFIADSFFRGLCYISVNLYVLISGYFLCKSSFKVRKLLSLVLETLFYSIGIFCAYYFARKASFTLNSVKLFFPVLCSQYWFITVYVGMYILAPALNKLIDALSKRQLQCIIAVTAVIGCIIPTFIWPVSGWMHLGGGCSLDWFLCLYFIAAYCRNYVSVDKLKENKAKVWTVAVISWFIPFITTMAMAIVLFHCRGSVKGCHFLWGNSTFLTAGVAIATFVAFLTVEIKSSKACKSINFIAKSALATYLITEHPLVAEKLWGGVQEVIDIQTLEFIWQFLLTVIVLFVVCTLIDLARRVIFYFAGKIIHPEHLPFEKKINAIVNLSND